MYFQCRNANALTLSKTFFKRLAAEVLSNDTWIECLEKQQIKRSLTTNAFAINLSHAVFNTNEVFRNDNRRHVYNIDDYVYFVVVNKTLKNQLVQFFSHIYRDNIYEFFVCFAIQNFEKIDDSDVMNFVLKLLVRRRRIIQIIHEIHALSQKKLYLIETKNEDDWDEEFESEKKKDAFSSYLVKCNWDIEYLWMRKTFALNVDFDMSVRRRLWHEWLY